MRRGGIDIFHSRRGMFNFCTYWLRNENSKEPNELLMKKEPNGHFYAKETAPRNDSQQTVGDFMYRKETISLMSNDDLSGITANSMVKFRNQMWVVSDVQKQIHRKESEYNSNLEYSYYLELRR